MRQWELFGITDSDTMWTPPVKVMPESESIVRIIQGPAEGEDELEITAEEEDELEITAEGEKELGVA